MLWKSCPIEKTTTLFYNNYMPINIIKCRYFFHFRTFEIVVAFVAFKGQGTLSCQSERPGMSSVTIFRFIRMQPCLYSVWKITWRTKKPTLINIHKSSSIEQFFLAMVLTVHRSWTISPNQLCSAVIWQSCFAANNLGVQNHLNWGKFIHIYSHIFFQTLNLSCHCSWKGSISVILLAKSRRRPLCPFRWHKIVNTNKDAGRFGV